MATPLTSAPSNPTRNSIVSALVKHKYTKSPDSLGWLRIKMEPSGEDGYLCEYVKVSILDESERTLFLILEGQHRGKKASVRKENAAKYLVDAMRGPGAKLVAKVGKRERWTSKVRLNEQQNQLGATLLFNGMSATITLDSDIDFEERNPLSPNRGKWMHSKPRPNGTYNILVPEIPKAKGMTEPYRSRPGGYPELRYDTVWFPIEYAATQNSNFVHVGNLSEGCVTMWELKMWNPL